MSGCASSGTTAREPAAPLGAVAVADRFSAGVAEDVLRRGGNAIDAAVATAFALAVTYPEAGNIGGGGFMLIRFADENYFLDYRETAPAAAHRDMYLDNNGEVIAEASLVGHKAAGVPGTVAGLYAAHQRFGRLPWADLVGPSIALARGGFEVPELLAERVAENLPHFHGKTNFADYFGQVSADQRFRQNELANALTEIALEGADAFYAGEIAQAITTSMAEHGGLITADDLANYRAIWRQPLTARWRDYTVVSAPPPSSGGVSIIQLLGMREVLSNEFGELDPSSAQYVHLVAEMSKRVFADRAEYFGDPDVVDVPVEALSTPDYIARRAAEVNPRAISTLEAVRPGLAEGRHTTHFSIVDADGNAVSNTYTINTAFGSGVVVEGAGFLLNNEMDDFSAKPGTPNYFGVVGNEANAIAPGKRMLSS
ncbi:MAG: gamma-glutamyltransferase, partial [Pseudomonadota bacterium]